jgi:hypothetical protein
MCDLPRYGEAIVTYRVANLAGLGVSVVWQGAGQDKHVARNVVSFLEDRRVLFGDRQAEDEVFCIQSANEARRFLTDQLARVELQESLAASLRAMRLAFRRFVDAAGPHGAHFKHWTPRPFLEADPFSVALGELRSKVGLHVALMSFYYELDIEDELAAIVRQFASDEAADLA